MAKIEKKIKNKKSVGFWLTFVTFLFCVVGLVFDLLSYFLANYYKLVFGEDNSIITLVFIIIAIVLSLALAGLEILFPRHKYIRRIAALLLTVCITVAFTYMIFDRLEAIGNCVVTAYDAGFGGEEACYLTFVGFGFLVVAAIINIVGTGLDERKDKTDKKNGKKKDKGAAVQAA